MSTPEGAFSVFPLDAAVTAPAGALSVFHHYRCSDCSPQERYLYFPHCPSSDCSRRSAIYIPSLPQQCSLQQEPSLPPPPPQPFFPPLPQQCPLPQEPSLYFHHCRSSVYSRRSLFCISPRRSSDCSSRSAICISSLPL